MSLLAWPLMMLLLAAGETQDGGARLSDDPRRIAFGMFLDAPVPAGTIERSLEVLSGLRCRYGLHGGIRDDEEAARRALAEVEALEFTSQDRARMAKRLGVPLAPALCGAACEQFESMVLVRLRMEALEKLAAAGGCGESGADGTAAGEKR